jgi:hypothetical protein
LNTRVVLGHGLITLSIVGSLATGLVTHWTTGHLTDSAWPPHARFHLLLYDGAMILFSTAALWCLWGPRRHEWLALRVAAFTVPAFFLPLFPAALFPNASAYATAGLAARGGMPPNLLFAGLMIVVSLAGYFLSRRTGTAPAVSEGS